ncbi:BCCT family transporter [Geomicrobium sp. JSM 1781026]|uniref:BCCT family transporter n=1 Tax=Geomicrobium sp. JSM 1781026 TaxID=3344580 RepID=UPI0035C012DA
MANHYTYKTERPGIVFIISAIFVFAFVLWGVLSVDSLNATANTALDFMINTFGWFYMIVTAFFVAFCIFLIFSPYGKLRLGKKDDRPEYNFYTWIGMIFAAGIGVGFVFWGVAEPVLYYLDTPPGVEPGTTEAASSGLLYGSFHWSLHVWAIFGVVGLTLAYVQFRKDKPALISSAFTGVLGDRMRGLPANTIDILSVIATAMGVATTFGLSALQMSAGLSYITPIENNFTTQFIIIGIVTVLFMFSAMSGVNRGIKYLSTVNLTIAAFLLLFVIIVGPTQFLAENFVSTLGSYISNIIPMSLQMTPFSDSEWLGNNTIFFWAWHMSWAPFIGLFVARVSRGRTVREYMLGVLVIPSLVGIIWFVTFGGTGLYQEIQMNTGISELVAEVPETALFDMLTHLPLAMFTSILAFVLIGIFFITSADSASYVLGVMTSKGGLKPMLSIKFIWGFLIAAAASVLLLSGGLDGLQTAAIVSALPFSIIMAAMVIFVLIMMSRDLKSLKREESMKQTEQLKEDIKEEFYDDWKQEVYEEIKEEMKEDKQTTKAEELKDDRPESEKKND